MEALGLIEVIGLVGAIEAIDTASKAADVKVIGYEVTKGAGMVVVKMTGGVSAVKAAVDAATIAAEKLTRVVSKLVIARPSIELDKILPETKEKKTEKIKEEVAVENIELKKYEEVKEQVEEIKLEEKKEETLEIEKIKNKKNKK